MGSSLFRKAFAVVEPPVAQALGKLTGSPPVLRAIGRTVGLASRLTASVRSARDMVVHVFGLPTRTDQVRLHGAVVRLEGRAADLQDRLAAIEDRVGMRSQ